MVRNVARGGLIFVFFTTLFLGYFLKDLQFNYAFEDFFPADDPDLEYYQMFRERFENDNNYLLIGLVAKSSAFDSTFLNRTDSLTHILENLPDVTTLTSLTNTNRILISGAGYFEIPLIHVDEPERYEKDSITIFKNSQWAKSLVDEEAKSLAIIMKHREPDSKAAADVLSNAVESAISDLGFTKYHIAGKIYAQKVFIEKISKELFMFLLASMLLVVFFLGAAYRSWWGIVVPLVVVAVSGIWILGIMGINDKPLDILMVLLPTIIFVVGMSDVVHIMTKYIEQLRLGDNKVKAISITFREVGLATFLTSVTTAVGFLTLLTASMKPIQGFGLYTAIGVFVAFIVAFTLLPSCLMILPKPNISKKLVHGSRWYKVLSKAFLLVMRKRKAVIVSCIIILLISAYGISKISINTFLIDDLPKNDPLKMAFVFFDENYGGSRPFEMSITAPEGSSVFEPAIIKETERVLEYATMQFDLGYAMSPAAVVKSIHQATHGGTPEEYRLPTTERDWKKVNRQVSRVLKRKDLSMFVTNDAQVARISARMGDIGSALSIEKNEKLRQYIKNHTDPTIATFKITGTSNLIDKNNENLAINMFEGLAIAFGVVALIAGLLFRSVRMILITLIPNLIPLLMVAGVMGIFGITLKLSTSIIFTIAFGIAVDDTIHFTSKLKLELAKGKSLLYALKRTYLSTGKAIVVTSIILSGGFLTLILSSFGGTFFTGLLVSLTLIFALVIDLTLLPLLVAIFYNGNKSD